MRWRTSWRKGSERSRNAIGSLTSKRLPPGLQRPQPLLLLQLQGDTEVTVVAAAVAEGEEEALDAVGSSTDPTGGVCAIPSGDSGRRDESGRGGAVRQQ